MDTKQNRRREERCVMSSLTAWERMELIRHKGRPTVRDYIPMIFDEFYEMHGDRCFGDDAAILGGIAMVHGIAVTVLGQVKGHNLEENKKTNFSSPHPEGYRKALRLAKQAEKFGRPIICFIDTPGAFCGIAAEERGQGEAIARNLLEFSRLKVPVISIVLGEAGSGGALALGVCDELYMLENALYSVISPRGFASILWKDASKEKEAAEKMKMTAEDLLGFGICDGIIPEPAGGAHVSPEVMAGSIADTILLSLQKLTQKSVANLLEARYNKFRKIGAFEEQADFAKPAPEGLE
ncbi:MAG: acetyl-CoA carboxylase carboxyltransferase subunit alpha [Oscillospiraceae bacterium]|nr:acetyl-CoA carboxylase carboxyltransferase subunit alpha [Oscillospiraceae bacterium]